MNEALGDQIVRMAWEDRTTFEEIEKATGQPEDEVIGVMRGALKPGSFRLWRKRVTGRVTKHRKLMERRGIGKRARHSSPLLGIPRHSSAFLLSAELREKRIGSSPVDRNEFDL